MKRTQTFAPVIFLLIVLMYMYISFQRVTIPGQIFNELSMDFSLSASKLAAVGTMFMLVYAFTQIPAGMLIQKYGGLRVVLAASVFLAIGGMIFPFANSYSMLVISRILVGVGCSFVFPCAIDEANKVYGNHFATVVGTTCLCGFVTSALGTVPFVYAVHHFGWRICMLIPAILALLMTIALHLMSRKVEKEPVANIKLGFSGYWENITNRNNFLLILSYTTNYGIYFAVLSIFGKKFLEDTCGLSAPAASLVSMLLLIVPACYSQMTGILSAKLGNRRRIFIRIMGVIHPVSCGIILLGLLCGDFPGRGLLFSLALLIMSMVAGLTPITSSATKEYSSEGSLSILTGLINFSAYAMVFIFGTIAGYTMQFFGGTRLENGTMIYSNNAYIAIFGIFLAITLVTCRMAFMVPETNGKNILANKFTKKRFGIRFHY